MRLFRLAAILVLCFSGTVAAVVESDIAGLIATVKRVDKHGAGHPDAVAAVKQLQQADGSRLLDILAGMDDAGPLETNWLRGAFETVAERELKAGRPLPNKALETFVRDTKHGDRARRLAYEWLVRVDDSAANRLMPTMLDDPSLELRYDAIVRSLDELKQQEAPTSPHNALAKRYREVLTYARDLEQIKEIADKLKSLGEEVDLPTHFGFVMRWNLIGPFDNTDGKGFAMVYTPEKALDFAAQHEGKSGPVGWKRHTTADPHGVVDLNKALDKYKDSVAYAAAEFISPRARPVDLRLGCINACKIWLNGELLLEREVYHTAMEIDQYVGKGTLKRGHNVILVKICQNDQKEDWAQNWQFQLRVCDERGTSVPSDQRGKQE